jgi:hypothetical protein
VCRSLRARQSQDPFFDSLATLFRKLGDPPILIHEDDIPDQANKPPRWPVRTRRLPSSWPTIKYFDKSLQNKVSFSAHNQQSRAAKPTVDEDAQR